MSAKGRSVEQEAMTYSIDQFRWFSPQRQNYLTKISPSSIVLPTAENLERAYPVLSKRSFEHGGCSLTRFHLDSQPKKRFFGSRELVENFALRKPVELKHLKEIVPQAVARSPFAAGLCCMVRYPRGFVKNEVSISSAFRHGRTLFHFVFVSLLRLFPRLRPLCRKGQNMIKSERRHDLILHKD